MTFKLARKQISAIRRCLDVEARPRQIDFQCLPKASRPIHFSYRTFRRDEQSNFKIITVRFKSILTNTVVRFEFTRLPFSSLCTNHKIQFNYPMLMRRWEIIVWLMAWKWFWRQHGSRRRSITRQIVPTILFWCVQKHSEVGVVTRSLRRNATLGWLDNGYNNLQFDAKIYFFFFMWLESIGNI